MPSRPLIAPASEEVKNSCFALIFDRCIWALASDSSSTAFASGEREPSFHLEVTEYPVAAIHSKREHLQFPPLNFRTSGWMPQRVFD